MPAPNRSVNSPGVPAGTPIQVQINETLDSDILHERAFVLATVSEDVKGVGGGLAVPADSSALLVVRHAGKEGSISHITIGINRIQVEGKTLKNGDGARDMATLVVEEDGAKGAFHRSVHLQRRSTLTFKLESAVQFH